MRPHLLHDIPFYRRDHHPPNVRIVEWNALQQHSVDSGAFCDRIDQYAHALLHVGLNKGDYVCVQSAAGSIDILAIEFAVLKIGAIVCPLHVHWSAPTLSGILSLVKPAMTLVIDAAHKDKFVSHAPADVAGRVVSLAELELTSNVAAVDVTCDPGDVALIIFTSGTTGEPKGVMLTHNGMIANVIGALAVVPVDYHDTVLSFLPISHVFERVVMYTYLTAGVNIHFASSARHARVLFPKVNPHYITAVPRILERVFRAFLAAADRRDFFRNQLVHWAQRQSVSGSRFSRMLVRWIVLRRLRPIFGRRLKGVLVGGAAMDIEIIRFFETARIAVREGYGLTESGGVVSVNRFSPGEYLAGSVGLPLPGVEVRIETIAGSESGEILVRSPGNMVGYLNDAEATRSVLSDGWLRTGDVGKFVHHRFLKITSRAKDIFKNSYGEYVVPANIERLLLRSPFVDQVIAVGFQRPFTAVLIRPDFEHLQRWCAHNGVHWTAPLYMVHNPEVLKQYQTIIDAINPGLSKHERVMGFQLVHEEWTMTGGLLTVSMKLRRVQIEEQYRKRIDEIYK